MDTPAIFPRLLDFVLLAPFMLRIFVSLFIFKLGLEVYNKKPDYSLILYFVTIVTLVLGLYTQAGAIIGIVTLKYDFYRNYWSKKDERVIPKNYFFLYTLAGVILLSFLVTGPGFLAFDLPF